VGSATLFPVGELTTGPMDGGPTSGPKIRVGPAAGTASPRGAMYQDEGFVGRPWAIPQHTWGNGARSWKVRQNGCTGAHS